MARSESVTSTRERGRSTVEHCVPVLCLLPLNRVLSQPTNLRKSVLGDASLHSVGNDCVNSDNGRGDGDESVRKLLRVIQLCRFSDILTCQSSETNLTPGQPSPFSESLVLYEPLHRALVLSHDTGRGNHRR